MGGGKGLRHLLDQRKGFLSGETNLTAKALGQRFALQQLHSEESDFTVRGQPVAPEVEDAADVRVRDLTRQLNFVPEAADRNGVRGEIRANGLQGDADSQLEILSLIHFSHSTLAD
jgi:hypothetical protein